jgi:hypothetical protein
MLSHRDGARVFRASFAADPTRLPLATQALSTIRGPDQQQRFQLAIRITLSGIVTLIAELHRAN